MMSNATLMDLKYDAGEIEHRRNLVKANPNRFFTKKNNAGSLSWLISYHPCMFIVMFVYLIDSSNYLLLLLNLILCWRWSK
jgi:hypothetical protein